MEVIGIAANVIAVVDLSVKVGSLCLQYAKDVNNASADINRLREEVASLQKVTEQVQSLLDKPNGERLRNSHQLDAVLKQSYFHLDELDQRLESKPPRKLFGKLKLRTPKWPLQRGEVEALVQSLRQYNETISSILQVSEIAVPHKRSAHAHIVDQSALIPTLPVASGAPFDPIDVHNTVVCLQNTRVELLQQIKDWGSDSSSETIFWLNGMSGTGKSTVARTVCQDFARSGRLGASFFFKRDETDRGTLARFITTIAAQLANLHPKIASHIQVAIYSNPAIYTKSTQEQFDKLIHQPLAKFSFSSPEMSSLVFVIDAIDQCGEPQDAALVIDLFSSLVKESNRKVTFKCLFTSTPGLCHYIGFNSVNGVFDNLILHQESSETSRSDISTFLQNELSKIRTEYNRFVPTEKHLPSDWISRRKIIELARMTSPFFSLADAACRFIGNRTQRNPYVQLRDLVEFQMSSQPSQFGAIYLPILSRLAYDLPPEQHDDVFERFRAIIGPLITLKSPLSGAALSEFLNIRSDVLEKQVALLSPVLCVSELGYRSVRVLHQSFREFLVDPKQQRTSPFWVNEKDANRQMATGCLNLMNKHLHTNLCGLMQSATKRSSIEPQTIESQITPELQYACINWIKHMHQAQIVVGDNDRVHTFLRNHISHWLEALSLVGRASESLKILESLRLLFSPTGSQELRTLVHDALKLIQANISTIDDMPLQIYSPGIAPTTKTFQSQRALETEIPLAYSAFCE